MPRKWVPPGRQAPTNTGQTGLPARSGEISRPNYLIISRLAEYFGSNRLAGFCDLLFPWGGHGGPVGPMEGKAVYHSRSRWPVWPVGRCWVGDQAGSYFGTNSGCPTIEELERVGLRYGVSEDLSRFAGPKAIRDG